MVYWISYVIIKLLSKIYFPCTFYGKEHLPRKGAFLIASNHLSNLDPIILGISLWRRFSYIAKDSLFKNKVLSFFLFQVGAFPIKRDTADFRAIRESLRRLRLGCPLILFPEGTRGVGREKKPQAGIGLIAGKSQLPVIPALIEGSDQVLPPKARKLKRHQVIIKFGPPIHFSPQQSYEEMTQEIMNHIYYLSSLPVTKK